MDDQTAADTNAYTRHYTTGAVSFLFVLACRQRLATSYDDLVRHINEALAGSPRPDFQRALEEARTAAATGAPASGSRGLPEDLAALHVAPLAAAASASSGAAGDHLAGYLATASFGQTLTQSGIIIAAANPEVEMRMRALPQFRQRAQLCCSKPFPAELPLSF
jgi:hypothetical protein